MLYRHLDIPAETPSWKLPKIENLREDFITKAYEDNGVLRWKSNQRCVPVDIFRDAYCSVPDRQAEVVSADTSAFLSDYRERMKNHVPDAEEMFEMRAAFGTGRTVVNVLTGKRTRL